MITAKKLITLANDQKFFDFISENLHRNPAELALELHHKLKDETPYYISMLKIYQKSIQKLPQFTQNRCLFTEQTFQQASSEAMALYKADYFEGKNVLDLTGGLGVDAWAISQKASHITIVEPNLEHSALLKFNLERMHTHNYSIVTATAQDFINSNTAHFDAVYLDPDRRPGGKRSVEISDLSPNFYDIQSQIWNITDEVIIKCSPMLDVAQSVKKLSHVQQVVYAESDGELREIWVRMLKGSHEFAKMALSINKDIVLTHHGAPVEGLSYRSSARFFIDPGPSITKAGLCQSMAASIDAKLMHPNCCYMLTNQVTENIIGRFFQIVERCSYARLSAYLQEQGLVKANIAKRNFVLDVEAIRKKTKLKEGGDTYLFFTSEYPSQKPVVYICKKR